VIHYLKNKVAGPWALKHYHSLGICKIYYSHFIFEVITFLSKIQNHSKKIVNYGSSSKIGRKNHYLEFLKSKKTEGNSTTPKNCVLTEFLKSKKWKEILLLLIVF